MMDLGYILRRAWEISWRQKAMWPCGLAVGFATIGPRLLTAAVRLIQYAVVDPSQGARFSQLKLPNAIEVALLFSGTLVLYLASGLLGSLGRAGLVGQANQVENHARTSIQQGWQLAKLHVWPTFLIHIALVAPIGGLAIAAWLPRILGAWVVPNLSVSPAVTEFLRFTHSVTAQACGASALCLSVIIAIPLNLLQRLALRGCILENRGALAAIAGGWQTLKESPGTWIGTWFVLLLLIIGTLVALGLPLVLISTLGIAGLLLAVTLSLTSWSLAAFLISAGALLAGGALLAIVQMIASVAWTLAYREYRGLGVTGE
ncbi:MAG: hypothetical protein GX620_02950 [Chloroflexi bacterium]|nr:hypothetical protein [Chloroflexota bacterium]